MALAALWAALAQGEAAKGPLRVLQSNPKYFTDGSGKAIFLTGSHNWWNFQDNSHRKAVTGDPAPAYDYAAYLEFLQSHGHNFFRLWRWESPKWMDEKPPGIKYCSPHPWVRTGPGTAYDEKLKFDLSRFDPEYFDRMRARITAARDKGIYVSIMLFEGWAAQQTDAWQSHPFHAPNNVNEVDADALGYYTVNKTAMGRRILDMQEAYLRKVVDTVNDLDNVLYEVCNESGPFSLEWQYHVVRFVKKYEAGKPRQHPVGVTVPYPYGTNPMVFDSPADWVSPNRGGTDESYLENPSSMYRGKVIVNDTDHLLGHTGGDAVWVWKSFCRGLNVLFMEEMMPSPTWQDSARDGMGQAHRYSVKVDLASMTPQDKLSGTGYCLANAGKEYLVFQPGNQGEFSVNLTDARGSFTVEWLNVNTGATVTAKATEGGARRTFTTPFPGPAVLYLKRR
jgi:hypothetical protein